MEAGNQGRTRKKFYHLGVTYHSRHEKPFVKRTETSRTANTLERCESQKDGKYDYSVVRNSDHLFAYLLLPIRWRKENFMTSDISKKAIQITAHWDGTGI